MQNKPRKIIHVDMDCFYAAIEIRDRPELAGKPVAVGGPTTGRGVLCTCNYIAREYGVRSAMPTAQAYRLCPDLILLPVNMLKYKEVAKRIHAVFKEFTPLVEPLALDEAYLDVTDISLYQGSATLMAQAIRQRIWQREKLTASAGVAPNKYLAKIASGWKKPNGLFVIPPGEVEEFVKALPVNKLFGVGKVTAEKMYQRNLRTCFDLQKLSLTELRDQFGKLGENLYEQCRGIDRRSVDPNRIRKSLSVERTFMHDLQNLEECLKTLPELYDKLVQRLQAATPYPAIKSQYIKIKFNDFKLTSTEMSSRAAILNLYEKLIKDTYTKDCKPVRLLGLGVHFAEGELLEEIQPKLF